MHTFDPFPAYIHALHVPTYISTGTYLHVPSVGNL